MGRARPGDGGQGGPAHAGLGEPLWDSDRWPEVGDRAVRAGSRWAGDVNQHARRLLREGRAVRTHGAGEGGLLNLTPAAPRAGKPGN